MIMVNSPNPDHNEAMLERLLELGKSVLAESDLDGVLTAAIDGVIELCGAERGLILLFDPDGEAVVETARNLRREDIERPEFEVSRTILDKVRAEGEPFWHPNVLDDPAMGHKASVLRLLILSVICQPIRDGGRTLGVVYLDNRSAEGVFTEETARLVASFSEFISLATRNALERRRLDRQIHDLAEELRGRYDFSGIVGQDPRILAVLKMVAQVADSEATVLIQGESGTGKELIARALHFNSRRRTRPSCRSTAERFPRRCWSPSCSDTCAAPSPARCATIPAGSNGPKGGRWSSTRSASWRRHSR